MSDLEKRRKTVALGILLAGWAAALLIYLTAPPPDPLLALRQEETKQYLRQMELYGGKANVLASEIRERFAALWQGRSLAYTVAVLSVLAAVGAFVALNPLPPLDPPPPVGGDQAKADGKRRCSPD